jgi:hypothetical protein
MSSLKESPTATERTLRLRETLSRWGRERDREKERERERERFDQLIWVEWFDDILFSEFSQMAKAIVWIIRRLPKIDEILFGFSQRHYFITKNPK